MTRVAPAVILSDSFAYLNDTTGPDCQVGPKSGLPAAIDEGSVFYE